MNDLILIDEISEREEELMNWMDEKGRELIEEHLLQGEESFDE